jgi:hypothetical protein
MRIKLFIILILLSSFSFSDLFAQKFNKKFGNKKFRVNIEFDDDTRPLMEFNYGLTEVRHKSFSDDFAKVGNAEIKLGRRYLENFEDEGITEMKDEFLFFGINSLDLKDKNAEGLGFEMINFGFGMKEGLGYEFGIVNVTPYFGGSFTWNKLNMKEFPDTSLGLVQQNDLKILDRYNKTFKFGQRVEGGLSIGLNKTLFVDASYQANVVFPKVMTWKHLGSLMIEVIGIGLADSFVEEVRDASPVAAPIINFLLKNGVAYGFYMLQKDKMNYPFNSETPLTYETFKVGVTFVF